MVLNLLGNALSLLISEMGNSWHLLVSFGFEFVEDRNPLLEILPQLVTSLDWFSNCLKSLKLLTLNIKWGILTFTVDPFLSLSESLEELVPD